MAGKPTIEIGAPDERERRSNTGHLPKQSTTRSPTLPTTIRLEPNNTMGAPLGRHQPKIHGTPRRPTRRANPLPRGNGPRPKTHANNARPTAPSHRRTTTPHHTPNIPRRLPRQLHRKQLQRTRRGVHKIPLEHRHDERPRRRTIQSLAHAKRPRTIQRRHHQCIKSSTREEIPPHQTQVRTILRPSTAYGRSLPLLPPSTP